MGVVTNKFTVRMIAQSAAAVSLTGSVSETVLATISIPAGTMGANGCIRVWTYWTNNSTANNKTARVRFGAAGAGVGGSAFTAITQTTNITYKIHTNVYNRAATNSQFGDNGNGAGGWSAGTGAYTTAAIDTTAASEIAITGQLALGTDTLTLEAYTVEVVAL